MSQADALEALMRRRNMALTPAPRAISRSEAAYERPPMIAQNAWLRVPNGNVKPPEPKIDGPDISTKTIILDMISMGVAVLRRLWTKKKVSYGNVAADVLKTRKKEDEKLAILVSPVIRPGIITLDKLPKKRPRPVPTIDGIGIMRGDIDGD